jgi:hypothetical protein
VIVVHIRTGAAQPDARSAAGGTIASKARRRQFVRLALIDTTILFFALLSDPLLGPQHAPAELLAQRLGFTIRGIALSSSRVSGLQLAALSPKLALRRASGLQRGLLTVNSISVDGSVHRSHTNLHWM